ncbi:hypothetical protein I5M32_07855 [Pedobacter sp. SD-b]|uniref:DUF2254 domain-containing protein n=1 Tax=Pedobacter segetis TaxID=2793069 RepID=A0ABS1BJ89_9SPHI|nr:hypothetical protein [Pedobacter segetis]MBK0382872.1 hypothetical protein [Pedobacter segetis]
MNKLLKWKQKISKYGYIIYPFLVIFLFGFVLYYFPFQVIPDYLKISSYTKIYETFNLIISSLVSLIGVYITVSLVAYEFFKQKSGIDFSKSLIQKGPNAYFIATTVTVILFSFLSSLLIPNTNLTSDQVTIIYYNCFLFIGVIVSLFLIAFNLFSSLRPEKLANDELQKINLKTILIKESESKNIDEQAEIIENDHLIRVETIVLNLISVSENFKAQALIQKISLHLCRLIIDEENKHNKEYIIKRLISFYIQIIDLVSEQPNSSVILRSIWNSISRIYDELIERKETAVHYKKFREEFFTRFFNRLLNSNNEEVIFEGILTIKNIIQNQVLENMADDKEIYFFHGYRKSFEKDFKYPKDYLEEDFRKEDHWREIAVELMNSFTYLINKGISLNKPDLINKCFEEIQDLSFKLDLKSVGIYKQTYFYINAANITCDYSYRAFEKNVFVEGHDARHILPSLFTNLIEEKHIAARTVLQKYCYLLINLQKINKLDRWFLGGLTIGDFITTEGDLGGIAKRCAIKFNSGKEIQHCLDDCIKTYAILKEYYEKNPPKDWGYYTVIKWQLKNILEWLEKEKANTNNEIKELKNLIESFKESNTENEIK